ncbi:Predicted SnoaL-like aldol condensation-catalyzing enzyme [Stigmatella aurantiaca]|uniref:Predicted SnoaL-like aldol condensation-catalyzing enzyme n=1 Tax=Stigmatella aurantiaca TaxID=41 RepID=A0A1H7WZH3_STIAU|nr:ester cyclase [Stigmatella aurantiaca]SEM27036.1 Predicted SnoaL-like aldol condensation-catalyzing enzyme [Stigmatella aurantiaca]
MTRTLLLALPLLLATHCATSSKRRNLAQEAENKRIVQAFAEEVYGQHRLERIPVYVAEDFVDLSEGAPENARGPAYLRAQEEASLHELPGLQFRILHLLADGDLVHLHWKAEGPASRLLDETAEAKTQPPPLQLTGHTLFQLKQGRIVASWSVVDTLGLMLQQGFKVLPPVPEPAPKPATKP